MRLKYALLILILASSGGALGHARFKIGSITPPRDQSSGLKTPECGSVPRTATPKVFKPGEVINVEWEETVNHLGYFMIRFSKENDTGFDNTVLVPQYIDDQNGDIENGAKHFFHTDVTLPNLNCDACTLQLVQVMQDPGKKVSNYYSCSDIQLVGPLDPNTPPVVTTPTSEPLPKTPGKKPDKPQGLKIYRSK